MQFCAFRRYENASLVYTGLPSKHEGENVGLFDTILSAEDYYKTLYTSQQESLSGIGYDNSEIPDLSAAVSSADDEGDDEDEPEEPVVIMRRKTEDPLSIHKTTAFAEAKCCPGQTCGSTA
jgi:hypothetical protein